MKEVIGREMESKFRKLKPRPGRSGQGVERHQRARLHAATIELVAAGGFGALTVTGLARTAGVANRTFYENFETKEECFLATYDLIVRNAAREVLAAQHRKTDLQSRVSAGVVAFLHTVDENPDAARLALLEAPEVEATVERTRRTTGLFEALVVECFAVATPATDLPPPVARGIVSGIGHCARSHLLSGARRDSILAARELTGWVLAVGTDAANHICTPGRPTATMGRSAVEPRRETARG
jgi:AcrR family transcriptional regulator